MAAATVQRAKPKERDAQDTFDERIRRDTSAETCGPRPGKRQKKENKGVGVYLGNRRQKIAGTEINNSLMT